MILAACFPSDSFWYIILSLALVWVVCCILDMFKSDKRGKDE